MSNDNFDPALRRVQLFQRLLDSEEWTAPEDAYPRVIALQGHMTSSFKLSAAHSRHGLHVSTCITASRRMMIGSVPVDAVQVIVEKERRYWFGRSILIEFQAIVRPEGSILVSTGSRLLSLPPRQRPEHWTDMFSFQPDGRGKLFSEEEFHSWWQHDVLGWMSDKLEPARALDDEIQMPLSASPEMIAAAIGIG
jgi:hypothetical protein